MNLFVYGTLKRGERYDLSLNNGTFKCKGTVKGKLIEGSYFPMLIRSEISDSEPFEVEGDVFEINEDLLDRLDLYEGFHGAKCPLNLFNRELLPVKLEDGSILECWVYVYNEREPDECV